MSKILGNDINFKCMDVFDVPLGEKYNILLCAGGLYHLNNPEKLLRICHEITKHYLVVQSVVTLETEDGDYFVKPAPGWKHGGWFTDARLRDWLERIG